MRGAARGGGRGDDAHRRPWPSGCAPRSTSSAAAASRSLLLEGGAELAGSFLDAGEVDQLRLFYAPLLLGGGRPLAVRSGASEVAAGERPLAVDWERSGDDVLLRARLREW